MRITPDKMHKLDGKICFICGHYLLNNTNGDLAYVPVHTGESIRAKPDRYYIFECPNCGMMGHKRCWHDVGETRVRGGFLNLFTRGWKLSCPNCGYVLAPLREDRVDWEKGYQIPGHPDEELYELRTKDVLAYKAGSLFGKVGAAIDGFFKAVGLSSLTSSETNAVVRAANRIGKTIKDVAERVFRLEIPAEQRSEIQDLTCQNCGAPLPMPGRFEEAVVCEHCGTAHLLPT